MSTTVSRSFASKMFPQLTRNVVAYGDEGTKSWFGYDSWRQDRLKALKKKYDPKGMFSFYAPIA